MLGSTGATGLQSIVIGLVTVLEVNSAVTLAFRVSFKRTGPGAWRTQAVR